MIRQWYTLHDCLLPSRDQLPEAGHKGNRDASGKAKVMRIPERVRLEQLIVENKGVT
jgi:hypothetical protein